MRATVFTDGALGRQAGRFVWLAIDTERAANALLKRKLGVEALPAYFVVDPSTEASVLKWVGGATVPQLTKILDDGALAVKSRGGGFDEALARADRLYADRKYAEAAPAYRELLAKAPRGWKSASRATESLLFALSQLGQNEACAVTARDAFARLRSTPSSANVAGSGLSCALETPADTRGRAELVSALVADCREVVADAKAKIAADDRAALYDTLMSERDDAKDAEGKKKVAAEMAAFLEGESTRARSAEERASLDSWRIGAYLAMGEPEKVVTALQRSERDLPGDYNPPARLALAYKAMKRWEDALAASDRALAKVYGPRKLVVLRARADIYAGKGDAAGAKKTLEEALAFAEALPEGQRSEATIASLKKKIEAM